MPAPAGPLRERVVALAAARLGTLGPDVVPASLRAFVRFTPSKRARLAAVPLHAALVSDPVLRQAVAAAVAAADPALVEAVEAGEAPLEDAGALAWLRRPQGWQQQVDAAAAALRDRAAASAQAAGVDAVQRLTEQLEASRAAARAETERLRAELAAVQEQVAALRRDIRSRGDRTARAEAAVRAAERALADQQAALAPALAAASARAGEAEARAQRAEAALTDARQAARTAAREGRAVDELRLRVLLDALMGAATGLRRELALPPAQSRPADAVAGDYVVATAPVPLQGRDADDPALLDALLAVPMTHLLVDGYNVTKTGYGEVSLEAQRGRLLTGLGGLAARTAAEVTVVFDGAERVTPLALAAPRGVRLLFSRAGETADEVLVRLVGLEPTGRPVLVVSSDREVAEGTARAGGRAVPSQALLRLLGRGG